MRTPIIVSAYNPKGGVGKTLVTSLIAVSLAKRGKRVLVKDLDPQGSISEFMIGYEKLAKLEKKIRNKIDWFEEFLSNVIWLSLEYNTLNKAIGKGLIDDMIITVDTGYEKIDIFPVLPSYYDLLLSFKWTFVKHPIKIDEFLSIVGRKYDYVLLDFPPQVTPWVKEFLKEIDIIVPPAWYGSISDVRPIAQLMAKAYTYKEIIEDRVGKFVKGFPVVTSILLNYVHHSVINKSSYIINKKARGFISTIKKIYNIILKETKKEIQKYPESPFTAYYMKTYYMKTMEKNLFYNPYTKKCEPMLEHVFVPRISKAYKEESINRFLESFEEHYTAMFHHLIDRYGELVELASIR